MATTNRLVQSWKDALPSDLWYGAFSHDFKIDGVHYTHGAWNAAGDWWLAWNTDAEFREQLAGLADSDSH